MDDVEWLEPDELRAWRWFTATMLLLPGRLEEGLREHGLTFFEYSMLAGISASPDDARPMRDLAATTSGSPSRLSHAARRLEERGWIVREPSPDDGRVVLARLTREGRALLETAAPDHVTSVRRAFFDALTPTQVGQLEEIAAAVARGLSDGPLPWET